MYQLRVTTLARFKRACNSDSKSFVSDDIANEEFEVGEHVTMRISLSTIRHYLFSSTADNIRFSVLLF